MFIDNITNWEDFEKFVKRLYEEDSTVIVEHNQKLVGKSGAKRQIDVLITSKTKLHTYTTIAECKWWNHKVTRAIVDEVYSSIDDLNASKGAIFTKVGYQSGAKEYAKFKDIDIFVVRELKPEEWGSSGRNIQFYMHIFSCNIQKLNFPGAKLKSLSHYVPKDVSLDIKIDKDGTLDDAYALYSALYKLGPNLVSLLSQEIIHIQKAIGKAIGVFEEGRDAEIVVESEVELDFSSYDYRMLELGFGELIIDKISFTMITHIAQSSFSHDRGESFDIVLSVENVIKDQINIVSQKKGKIKTETIIEDSEKEKIVEDINDNLKNGSIMNISLDPWAKTKLSGKEKKIKTNKIIITLLNK